MNFVKCAAGLLTFGVMVLICSCSPPTVQQQHSAALRKHQYITDQEQYGIPNKWVASLKGDCEDYALVMKAKVGGQMLYVRAYTGEAHIVLDVDGMIVDNMSPTVYPRSEMKHKYIYTIKDSEISHWLAKAAEHDNLQRVAQVAVPHS